MSKFTAIAPQIVVADVVKTAEYYRDVLGFNIIDYFLNPPVYAMVERDSIQIHFGKADGESVQLTNNNLRKVGFDIYIWVTNIDELYSEYSSGSAEIIQPIVDRVYGNREFTIRDCNGFHITFGQM